MSEMILDPIQKLSAHCSLPQRCLLARERVVTDSQNTLLDRSQSGSATSQYLLAASCSLMQLLANWIVRQQTCQLANLLDVHRIALTPNSHSTKTVLSIDVYLNSDDY